MNTPLKPYITDEKQLKILERTMTGRLEYTLMNDFLSKYSFQKDLYALSGLLAALLNIDVDDITSIEILNPIEPAEIITDKNCVLDIKLELNHNEIINLEIQSRFQDFWPERSLTYLCRLFNNLDEGERYSDTKPCIQVGILGHDLFRPGDYRYTGKFYSEYRMQEVSEGLEYTSKFQIRVLSLNHLEDVDEIEKKDPNGLYFWAKLLTAKSWEELKMIAEKNPRMKSFVGTVRQLSAEEQVAEACERRRRYNQDIASFEGEIKDLKSEKECLTREIDTMRAEKDTIKSESDTIKAENDSIKAENDSIKAENDSIKAENDSIKAENDRLKALLKELTEVKK